MRKNKKEIIESKREREKPREKQREKKRGKERENENIRQSMKPMQQSLEKTHSLLAAHIPLASGHKSFACPHAVLLILCYQTLIKIDAAALCK